jgi:hypothetical protein
MFDQREGSPHRETASTASEHCFLCSRRIWPGDEMATLHGLPVHGSCFDRDVKPDLEPETPET